MTSATPGWPTPTSRRPWTASTRCPSAGTYRDDPSRRRSTMDPVRHELMRPARRGGAPPGEPAELLVFHARPWRCRTVHAPPSVTSSSARGALDEIGGRRRLRDHRDVRGADLDRARTG